MAALTFTGQEFTVEFAQPVIDFVGDQAWVCAAERLERGGVLLGRRIDDRVEVDRAVEAYGPRTDINVLIDVGGYPDAVGAWHVHPRGEFGAHQSVGDEQAMRAWARWAGKPWLSLIAAIVRSSTVQLNPQIVVGCQIVPLSLKGA
jgi:hypothetical protein